MKLVHLLLLFYLILSGFESQSLILKMILLLEERGLRYNFFNKNVFWL